MATKDILAREIQLDLFETAYRLLGCPYRGQSEKLEAGINALCQSPQKKNINHFLATDRAISLSEAMQ